MHWTNNMLHMCLRFLLEYAHINHLPHNTWNIRRRIMHIMYDRMLSLYIIINLYSLLHNLLPPNNNSRINSGIYINFKIVLCYMQFIIHKLCRLYSNRLLKLFSRILFSNINYSPMCYMPNLMYIMQCCQRMHSLCFRIHPKFNRYLCSLPHQLHIVHILVWNNRINYL